MSNLSLGVTKCRGYRLHHFDHYEEHDFWEINVYKSQVCRDQIFITMNDLHQVSERHWISCIGECESSSYERILSLKNLNVEVYNLWPLLIVKNGVEFLMQ